MASFDGEPVQRPPEVWACVLDAGGNGQAWPWQWGRALGLSVGPAFKIYNGKSDAFIYLFETLIY